ncbi:hypothetical protein HDU76_011182, partial [Blyttiomyces sp. JEL0837]
EGKLYLYESIFSGEVLGYVYSKVLPLDHKVAKGGYHLGPQIRDFEAVIDEVDSDVSVCPLDHEQRARVRDMLAKNPNHFLELYQKYHDYTYPMSVLPQLAAASEGLYKDLTRVKDTLTSHFPTFADKKDAVFCSELCAIVYKHLLLDSFKDAKPDSFTPLEVEVVPEFAGKVYYAKEDGIKLLKHGGKVPSDERKTKGTNLIQSLLHHQHWEKVEADGGVPAGSAVAGEDVDSQPLYIARVRIGDTVQI